MRALRLPITLLLAVACVGCGRRDGGGLPPVDAAMDDATSVRDASDRDGRVADAGTVDAGRRDAGASFDAGAHDGGTGADGGLLDGGSAEPDAGRVEPDAGTPPPTGGCVSGATGTHALRFRWEGTSSGSTAWVVYETNTLPDTSRWRVSAASMSIGYRPVFRDPFLGEGGLELSGTVFIDVELSTAGLSSVSNATVAVYGRSYNTTTSGSFTWQTFTGMGASPWGGVSNVAPYEWYEADATAELPAGDDGTLLRIRASGPSNALIVNRVEVCFTAT